MSSLNDSEEQTSPPVTVGSLGVHVASSHFSKIRAKSGNRGWLKTKTTKKVKLLKTLWSTWGRGGASNCPPWLLNGVAKIYSVKYVILESQLSFCTIVFGPTGQFVISFGLPLQKIGHPDLNIFFACFTIWLDISWLRWYMLVLCSDTDTIFSGLFCRVMFKFSKKWVHKIITFLRVGCEKQFVSREPFITIIIITNECFHKCHINGAL